MVGRISLLIACASLAACAHHPVTAEGTSQWVATWEAPPQLTEVRNLPPPPGLAGATLRQRLHLTLGGTRMRIRVSNEYGDGPLVVGEMRVALSLGDDRVNASSDRAVLFAGAPGKTLQAGEFGWSDEIAFATDGQSDVSISVFLPRVPTNVTGHPGSRTNSFIALGNHVTDAAVPAASRVEHWYVVSNIEVLRTSGAAAVVVLGNSIADGRGSDTDRNNRWPDRLARRLAENGSTSSVGVLNAGIGGNTVLRGGLGPTALTRFDRDVLEQRGVRWIIVSEGVNDIGGARGADSSDAVARELVAAYGEMIRRGHARGLRVYGATILPFGSSQYGGTDHERARQHVNDWIRGSGMFDAVIDFDAVMRDSTDPARLRADVDGGDHLHPNARGYERMADAVELALFGLSG